MVPVPIRRETTPPDNFISETTPSKINKYHNFNKLQGQGPPPGTTPKYQRLGGVVPDSQKRETTPLIISFQGPPPGTTPSKINKYHNFNKLQGQGPPPGTTPKISKIRGWSLTRKNERPPFDNFYIRDHPPGTTPPNIKDQGWSLARKNERPPPLIISFQGPPPETTKLVPTCHHNAP